MNENLLPLLERSHWPHHRRHYTKPPLRTKQQHAEHVQDMLKEDPEFFQRAADNDIPYGVWLCDDQTEVLFDYQYRPIWKRCGENPAVRADPTEWFDWSEVYWFYDHSLRPDNCPRLAKTTALVLDEFVSGGPLYVRRWRPSFAGKLMGKMVGRVYWRHGMQVIENYAD
jgi:hypothetical protein